MKAMAEQKVAIWTLVPLANESFALDEEFALDDGMLQITHLIAQ